ncbi:MAG TPA: ion channel [Chloroflexota bacterium]|jgi:hypothetical protein
MQTAQSLPGADEQPAPLAADGESPAEIQARSVSLLVSLFALMVVGPWLNERFPRLPIFEVLFSLVMLATILRLSVTRRQTRLGLLLGIPTIACLWLSKYADDTRVTQVALALLILFLLYSAVIILFYVMREAMVTANTLSAAFAVFLLIGFGWACIYGLQYLDSPAAFRLAEVAPGTIESGITPGVPMGILIYYSFITLTTVGYGDVAPVSAMARSMTALEAVLGHFYLAVLIGRLVGLSVAHIEISRRNGA